MKRLLPLMGAFLTLAIVLCAGVAKAQTIEPIFEDAKLLASDGVAEDQFGVSVSISGDTAVIGAWGDDDNGDHSGSAYIFVRDGNGEWVEQAKLLASDGAVGDNFGRFVSISGDTVIIGSHLDDDNGDGSGSAYVFVRDGNGVWVEQGKLIASDGAAGDYFGWSVSIAGDTTVIGAHLGDGYGSDSGSAYVFVRDSSGDWTEQTKLLASDGAAGDYFGRSVCVSGDTAVVGANRDRDSGTNSGSAYVFARDGNGNWAQQGKLLASDGAAGDYFGRSVCVSGDTAVVGSHLDDDNGDGSGSAYVFVRDGNGVWAEQGKLLASDGAAGDYFGLSVSISGDTAVIGAYGDDANGTYSGSAYVFARDGNGNWAQQGKLIASDGKHGIFFGSSVSVSGGGAVIGALNDRDKGVFSGSVYIYSFSTTIPEMLQDLANKVVELNISRGISNSLDAKLDATLQALDGANERNDVAAVNALNAFINAVMAQSGNQIRENEANELIADAAAIIAALSQ